MSIKALSFDWAPDEALRFAAEALLNHAPERGRCPICSHVRHPCETTMLAEIVIALLEAEE